MRHFFLFCVLQLAFCTSIMAQTEIEKYAPGMTTEGAVYYLPKTTMRITVRLEKKTYTPGMFAAYAQRFLRLNNVPTQASTSYTVIDFSTTAIGVPDKSKVYSLKFNAYTSASNIVLSDECCLAAINTLPLKVEEPEKFVPRPKAKPVDARNFMKAEIVSAGSEIKMAELTAADIYEIRDSKNMLMRGEADFMPKDGEQLKLMLARLDEQDAALTSLFTGHTETDTIETVIDYCPDRKTIGNKELLFRLSQHLGIVDKDDLSGSPYYIVVEDLKTVPPVVENPAAKKKKPVEQGVYVNVPGKVKATILKGTKPLGSFEMMLAQVGNVELLSASLFNKKYTTQVQLTPSTGAVYKINAEQPK